MDTGEGRGDETGRMVAGQPAHEFAARGLVADDKDGGGVVRLLAKKIDRRSG